MDKEPESPDEQDPQNDVAPAPPPPPPPGPAPTYVPTDQWVPPTANTPDPVLIPSPMKPAMGLGAGIGLAFAAEAVGLFLVVLSLGFVTSIWGYLWPFILIALGGIALMFSPRWRRFGTGVLIACAATWLIIIGPCIALIATFSY